MNETGRIADVLIKDQYMYPDNPDKKSLVYDCVTVYADAGIAEIIAAVEGVRKCHKFLDEFTYHAYLDPRYDRETVKRNIKIAVIMATKES